MASFTSDPISEMPEMCEFDSPRSTTNIVSNGIEIKEWTGGWTCTLCKTSAMKGTGVVRAHVNGSKHKFKYHQIQQARVEMLVERIEKVRALLYQYFRGQVEFEQAEKALSLCERQESIVVLELAAWKASCLSSHVKKSSVSYFRSMQDIYDYWAMDPAFNPLEYRRQCRITCGATVIMANVWPFLR